MYGTEPIRSPCYNEHIFPVLGTSLCRRSTVMTTNDDLSCQSSGTEQIKSPTKNEDRCGACTQEGIMITRLNKGWRLQKVIGGGGRIKDWFSDI